MIAGVEAHQIVMSTSMPCFTLKKKKVYKGGGGRETKGPPPATPLLRRTIRITHA